MGHSVLSRCDLEGIDLAPMLDLARVKLGNALKALKHGDLARDHTIDLECVAHESIARAFLMMVSSPDALPLFSSPTSKRDRTGLNIARDALRVLMPQPQRQLMCIAFHSSLDVSRSLVWMSQPAGRSSQC